MLLFRSEEHVERWRRVHGLTGATFSVETLWGLADAWFQTRLSPEWRRRTPEEAEALFESLGLTGAFWSFGVKR
jgi:hypothetical protein